MDALKFLKKSELDQKMKSLVHQERKLLHEILLTIKEIDGRKMFLDLGYANLFLYLTVGVGYSAGSAQRRIEAARLLKELPKIGAALESGDLKLHHISTVQKAARDVFKKTAVKVSSAEKEDLLTRISGKSFHDTEKEVASFFELPVLVKNSEQVQADGSVFMELTLSRELYDKIKQAQGLLSHALPTSDLVRYLEYMTDKVIKQKTSVREKLKPASEETSAAKASDVTSTLEPKLYSARQKKILLKKQTCCQYVDPETNKTCAQTWFLQADHKHSRWAQGISELSNAQILCAAHNQRKYRKENNVVLKSS